MLANQLTMQPTHWHYTIYQLQYLHRPAIHRNLKPPTPNMKGRRNSARKPKKMSQTETKAPFSNNSVSPPKSALSTTSNSSPPTTNNKVPPAVTTISPTKDTIPPQNDTTNDTRPYTHDRLSSRSLPIAFFDRTAHSCNTDIASNTPSCRKPDPFMPNRSPHDIPQVTSTLPILPQHEFRRCNYPAHTTPCLFLLWERITTVK